MMVWDTHIKASRLYYKLNRARIERLVTDSVALIRAFFEHESPQNYIALSGGKDSLVTCALVQTVQRTNAVFYTMGSLETPKTAETIERIEQHFGIQCHFLRVIEWEMGTKKNHPDYYISSFSRLDGTYQTVEEFCTALQFTGSFVGTRAEESTARRISTNTPTRRLKTGRFKGYYNCTPIAKWTTRDIWAYIITNDLPYHPAYRQIYEYGTPLERCRIGTLRNSRTHHFGATEQAKALWMSEYNQMLIDNPNLKK